MESVIKWRTGEPKEKGDYLITDVWGNITIDAWWTTHWRDRVFGGVIAWCPLKEIEPYKE